MRARSGSTDNLQLTPNYTVVCIDHLTEGSDRLVDIYLARAR